ncbi:MAG: ATP-binding protein [Myxococcales bacterium]|nr:ATP-binding protein [Myxococcales bacterium]
MAFDDRFALLVEAEMLARENARLAKISATRRRITDACIEGISFARERQLDKPMVRRLATCRWVTEHQTVIVTGATGRARLPRMRPRP